MQNNLPEYKNIFVHDFSLKRTLVLVKLASLIKVIIIHSYKNRSVQELSVARKTNRLQHVQAISLLVTQPCSRLPRKQNITKGPYSQCSKIKRFKSYKKNHSPSFHIN